MTNQEPFSVEIKIEFPEKLISTLKKMKEAFDNIPYSHKCKWFVDKYNIDTKIYNEKGEHVGFIDVFTDKKETVFNENDNLTIFLEPPKIKP